MTQRRGSSRTSSSRSDRSKHRYSGTSEFLAHVQLDDAPRAPIQQSFGDEFRQHNGVVTMMMFYRRRASPKHYNDMTEVEYGGRGHRTRLRNDHEDQLVCSRVPPASVYKGSKGVLRRPRGGRRRSPTPTGSRTPLPVPCPTRRGGGRIGKGGRRPSLLVQFGLGGEGACGLPWQPLPLLHTRPIRPINPPGGSGNPSGTPVLSETSPEPFRCPNIVIQYINLYVSTIPRLLVMSVITSGTPN